MVKNVNPFRIVRHATPLHSGASDLEKRMRLASLLAEAAEYEHNVMCQYLFAAFSMKRDFSEGGVTYEQLEVMRVWQATILTVAREEMEHLGLVCNLLTAIGESPLFERPNYPLKSPYRSVEAPSSLDAFSMNTILRFVCFEMPTELNQENLAILSAAIPHFNVNDYDGLAKLYTEIKLLFNQIDPKVLFIGDPKLQFDTSDIMPATSIRGVSLGNSPRYNIQITPVVDVASANKVIEQIMEEGEGASEDDEDSHFYKFLQIYEQLTTELAQHPDFAPARPVVSNPKSNNGTFYTDTRHINLITNKLTNQVSELFDLAYNSMVLMLVRFFGNSNQTQAELDALQYAAFFPFMTAVIRPLGEILTLLPAFKPGGKNPTRNRATAGASFELARRAEYLPHTDTAWQVFHMQLQVMVDKAQALSENPHFSADIHTRLTMVYENLYRVLMTYDAKIGLGGTTP